VGVVVNAGLGETGTGHGMILPALDARAQHRRCDGRERSVKSGPGPLPDHCPCARALVAVVGPLSMPLRLPAEEDRTRPDLHSVYFATAGNEAVTPTIISKARRSAGSATAKAGSPPARRRN